MIIIYVNSENGNDNNDGLTALTAKKTIKNAALVVNTGGTIHLSEGTYSGVDNTKIIIDRSMTIIGEGMDKTTIDGSSSSQIFKVNSGVIFNLKNLAISHAKAGFGGGLLNLGTVNIGGCKFSDCSTSYVAYGGGAAICNAEGGILNVLNSFFLNNNAKMSSTGGGGAVMTNGTTKLQSCIFKGNSGYSGGVLYSSNVANIEANGCSFINNIASNSGGVMFFKTLTSAINIHYSSFFGNTAMSGKPSIIDNGFNNIKCG